MVNLEHEPNTERYRISVSINHYVSQSQETQTKWSVHIAIVKSGLFGTIAFVTDSLIVEVLA